MRVEKVDYLEDYKLQILFSNNETKVVDFEEHIKDAKNMSLPLKDIEYFKKVQSDGVTIVWPNGYDACPDWLYMIGQEIKNESKTLYEIDFAKWINEQVDHLKAREFELLDMPNFIDEVESILKQIKKTSLSDMNRLILYRILKEYAPERITHFLDSSVISANYSLNDILEDCPSLREYIIRNKQKCYEWAKDAFKLETELYDQEFPEECPWTFQEILQ